MARYKLVPCTEAARQFALIHYPAAEGSIALCDDGRTQIGQDPALADLRMEWLQTISKQHCIVVPGQVQGTWLVWDMSANGTFIRKPGGEWVQVINGTPGLLQPEDCIRFGPETPTEACPFEPVEYKLVQASTLQQALPERASQQLKPENVQAQVAFKRAAHAANDELDNCPRCGAHIQELQAALQRTQQELEVERERLQCEKKRAGTANKELDDAIQQSVEIKHTLKAKVDAAWAEVDRLKSEQRKAAQSWQEEKAHLLTQHEEEARIWQLELQQLQGQLMAAKGMQSEHDAEAQRWRVERAQLQEQMEEQARSWQASEEQLQVEVQRLAAQHEEGRNALEAADSQLEAARSALNRLLEERDARGASWEEEREELRAEKMGLRAELERVFAEGSDTFQELVSTQERLAGVQGELAATKEQLASTQEQLASTQATLAQVQGERSSQMEALTSELSEAYGMLEGQQLAQLSSMCEQLPRSRRTADHAQRLRPLVQRLDALLMAAPEPQQCRREPQQYERRAQQYERDPALVADVRKLEDVPPVQLMRPAPTAAKGCPTDCLPRFRIAADYDDGGDFDPPRKVSDLDTHRDQRRASGIGSTTAPSTSEENNSGCWKSWK